IRVDLSVGEVKRFQLSAERFDRMFDFGAPRAAAFTENARRALALVVSRHKIFRHVCLVVCRTVSEREIAILLELIPVSRKDPAVICPWRARLPLTPPCAPPSTAR